MIHRSLRKTFWGCKTGKNFEEDLHLKEIEQFYNLKFSKVSVIRTGRSEDKSHMKDIPADS
jgi:hypothetical protein